MSHAFDFCIRVVSQSNIDSYFGHSLFSCLFCLFLMSLFVPYGRMTPIPIRLGEVLHTCSGNDFQIVHLLLFVKFVSPQNMEMKQEYATMKNKSQVGYRLLEALLALPKAIMLNLKALEYLITALDFERFHMNTQWIKRRRADSSDLNMIREVVNIHLPFVWTVIHL